MELPRITVTQQAGTLAPGAQMIGVQILVKGLGDLPTRYDGPVRNFLEYYLGTPDKPAPFGGRQAGLAALDVWLGNASAPSYALLAAPAGRGKSALLAKWVDGLSARDDVQVVYFPISLRYGTNRENVVFAALCARLARLYGEKATAAPDAQLYRGVVSDFLRRTPPDGRRLLVVLDGLDEAAGWEAGADLFPAVPPPHLRVVVAARYLAGDPDGRGWLAQLGWEQAGQAQLLQLPPLDRPGVADVLAAMGNPLDTLATQVDVVGRLHELSKGDPLLVRLYVEALLPRGAEAATFRPEDLETVPSGLTAYLDLWFKQQNQLWINRQIDQEAVDSLLNLYAMALGPLTQADVLALIPELKTSWQLHRAMREIQRLAIGDGSSDNGFVFSHPRLGEYFAERLTARERTEWQTRFLSYGRETLTALEAKTLKPEEAPAYAVRFYSAHLTQSHAPAAAFYALVGEGWLRAWEWHDGTPNGFLNDVRLAWKQAEAQGPSALGQSIRAALCFTSVVSVSANVPQDLLVACVQSGVLSPRVGLIIARQKPGARDRAESLARLSSWLPEQDRTAILDEALASAQALDNPEDKAQALSTIALALPETRQAEISQQALAAARNIPWHERDESARASMIYRLLDRLPGIQRDAVWKALFSAISMIDADDARAWYLARVADRLPPEFVDVALAAAHGLEGGDARATALSALSSRYPEPERSRLLEAALAAVHDPKYPHYRSQALGAVARHLPEPQRKEMIAEALTTARRMRERPIQQVRMLLEIAGQLPEPGRSDVLNEALTAAFREAHFPDRASALTLVAQQAPAADLPRILQAALDSLSEFTHWDYYLRDLLCALVQRLPEQLLDQAYSASLAITDAPSRVTVLAALLKRLPENRQPSLLRDALTSVSAAGDYKARCEAMTAIIAILRLDDHESIVDEAWAAARQIPYAADRASALGTLAECLKGATRQQVFAEALVAGEAYRASMHPSLRSQVPSAKDAVELAMRNDRQWFASRLLEGLGQLTPYQEPVLERARQEGFSLDEAEALARRVKTVISQLADAELMNLLRRVLSQCQQRGSAEIFRFIAPRWPGLSAANAVSEASVVSEVLNRCGVAERAEFLKFLKALLPILHRLGGEPVLRDTAQAIIDTARWWP